jgi:thiamine pyrophosphate-dependent acetolactate synthase large subunit-like protein
VKTVQKQHHIRRRALVKRLLENRGDMLVVTGLGSPTYDCAAAGDHQLNFYLWGAMGSAVTVGLGLALAQPRRRVLVVTGDGEMLMGLGALATVAVKKPANLAVAVIDNEHYGETGMQPTHTGSGVDLPGMARLHRAPGPVFVSFKVSSDHDPLVRPSWDGTFVKNRFRRALLGAAAG